MNKINWLEYMLKKEQRRSFILESAINTHKIQVESTDAGPSRYDKDLYEVLAHYCDKDT